MKSLLPSVLLLTACTVAPTRPASSSYGCMQAVRAQIPENMDDKQQHCLASALIAQQCSVTEAYLAGIGKELRDLFGAGDADWNDWRADRAGVQCARLNHDQGAVQACCAEQAASPILR